MKQNIIFKIVKDLESRMSFIEDEENRDIVRHRTLNSAKWYLNNANNNKFSQNNIIIIQEIVKTRHFLKIVKQLLVTYADKGNMITVVLN